MAYCDLQDVNRRCPARRFSATSIPSDQQVSGFIDDVSAEIDGILLARGYQPPDATATTALAILRRVAAIGAWCEVEQAAVTSQDAERAQKLWGVTRSGLESGHVELDLARRVTSGTGKVYSAATAFFSRDMLL